MPIQSALGALSVRGYGFGINLESIVPVYDKFQLNGIAYIGSQYLAVGSKFNNLTENFYTLQSSDAINWSEITTIPAVNPSSSGYASISASESNYALIGYASNDITGFPDNLTIDSTDGINFALTDTINSGYLGKYICSVYGDKFVFVKTNPFSFESKIYTSNDNITWTLANTISMYVNNIIWDGSQYIVCGFTLLGCSFATSSDGVTWSSVQTISSLYNSNQSVICYSGSQYVIASLQSTYSTSFIGALVSTDLSTWSQYTIISGFGGSVINCIIYANGQYVAVGDSSLIVTSPDGSTWTQRAISQFPEWSSFKQIIWDGSQYIAVGYAQNVFFEDYAPLIVTSTDGITWIQRV